MSIFDLRSDTVTRPSSAMREAMANAEVGDDVYREDPTLARLEEAIATITGKDAALFVPSGTMANQIAILCHTRPGDEIIVGRGAHCAYYESGAAPAWSGVQIEQVGSGGLFTASDVVEAIKPRAYYCPNTSLVVVENTHNRAGGKIFPQDEVVRIGQAAREHDLRLHLDGARLWNAEAATGLTAAQLCEPFDTIAVCFSKGLGAPVGSAICGDGDSIGRALRFRKMLGGGMRQAGIIAAGALFALEHNRTRIAEDHASAQRLGKALAEIDGVIVAPVESNIVNVELPAPASRAVARAKEVGVLFNEIGPRHLRMVTHLDIVDVDTCVQKTADALRSALRNP